MDLKDLELVSQLKNDLDLADRVLDMFQRAPGQTVKAHASAEDGMCSAHVELLPVDKSVAVSAAQRQRSKIVAQLQSLGVTVS